MNKAAESAAFKAHFFPPTHPTHLPYLPTDPPTHLPNSALSDDPGNVNKAAESAAWFAKFKISDKAEFEALMDASAYKKHTEK